VVSNLLTATLGTAIAEAPITPRLEYQGRPRWSTAIRPSCGPAVCLSPVSSMRLRQVPDRPLVEKLVWIDRTGTGGKSHSPPYTDCEGNPLQEVKRDQDSLLARA
jgi:hypothetical protein